MGSCGNGCGGAANQMDLTILTLGDASCGDGIFVKLR